jgi:hypothetical protein
VPDSLRRLAARRPAWIAPFFLALLALGAASCGGDSDEEPEQRGAPVTPPGDLASLVFEVVAYVEPSASNITVIDRVREETQTALVALGRRHVTISHKRQVDVDLKRLAREPVTVVDAAAHTSKPAIRLRYRFLGVGFVPREAARRKEMLLGALQRDDPARAAEVLDKCVAPADRVGEVPQKPWRAFDPSLEPCSAAMEAEQQSIDEARKRLEHPDKEIVPAEYDRLYLPVRLRIHTRAAGGGGGDGDDAGPAGAEGPAGVEGPAGSGKVRAGDPSGVGPAPQGSAPDDDLTNPVVRESLREQRMLDKLRREQRAGDDDDAAEEEEEANIRRRAAADGLIGPSASPGPWDRARNAAEVRPHNYTLIWFAATAMVILLGTEIGRRLRKRPQKGRRRPR